MMQLSDIARSALQGLVVHKVRSALTIIGVVIGIASIMVVMAIGGSARDLILNEMAIFGADIITINGGSDPSDVASAVLSDVLTPDDVTALERKENVPDAELINPSVSGSVIISYEDEAFQKMIIGSGEYIFEVYKIDIIEGEPFTAEDIASRNSVVVLGKDIAEDLFGLESPLDKRVKIKDKRYRVIGVATSQSASFFGLDDMALMPYTTAQQYVLGLRHFQEIVIKTSSPEAIDRIALDAERTLRDQHDLNDSEENDFYIQTPEDITKSIESVFGAITAFLGFVAAISLVVGGIGVMNIMLISVTERTREIGLRKALGATRDNILKQFLLEAVVLASIGGIVGVVTGIVVTLLITVVASAITGITFPFSFSWQGMVLGIVVAGGIGIVFGVFPARRAAQKSPIEALRYE